jgi:protein-disulfide isomerase
MEAAKAGECANLQNKFWPMHDKLFTSDDFGDEALKLYASQIGLDENKFTNCLASEQSSGLVLKDLLDGQALGVRGTPTWFIDNQKIEGDVSADAFKKVLDYLLSKQK